MSLFHNQRLRSVLALVIAPVLLAQSARAGATFSGASTAHVTHLADLTVGGGGASGSKNINPPPASHSMVSYSYNNTLAYNGATSVGKASVGAVTTSTITGFTLAAGSGVQQTDPSHQINSSELKLDVNGTWNISGSFGPTATGYVSLTLAGTVASPGSASYQLNLTFKDGANNNLRAPLVTSGTFGGGVFSLPYTSSLAFSPTSLGNGSSVHIAGSITLTADNGGGPTDISMPDFEVSSAPPTSRFIGNPGSVVSWANSSNWSTDILPTPVPNGVGVRARFVGPTTSTSVQLAGSTTLGTLDVDQPGLNIAAADASPLIFDTAAGNACLLVRNVQGESAHNIDGPIVLNRPLEIENDCVSGSLTLAGAGGTISGSNGLIVNGPGTVVLAGGATYTGPTTIAGGTLTLDATKGSTGLSGTNYIDVQGGATLRLISVAQSINQIGDSTSVYVQSGSLIELDFSGAIETVGQFVVNGVPQPPGVYSAFTAPVGFSADEIYFQGTGAINVAFIPEPTGGIALAMIGVIVPGVRRRRKVVTGRVATV